MVVVMGLLLLLLLVVLVVLGLVVVVLVVTEVPRLCPQDPLVFRWGVGVGHPLQPLELQVLVDSWSGFGAGLDRDRG